MSVLKDNILKKLQEKELSFYKISKDLGYSESTFSQMVNGKTPFSDLIKNKLLPILEVSKDEFESWILADKYSKEILELAIKAKKAPLEDETKLIFTNNLDKLLKEKNLSRTALSKEINYSQGKLNEMIIGKQPVSKLVLEKLSVALDVSEALLVSWLVADKCSLESLEMGLGSLLK